MPIQVNNASAGGRSLAGMENTKLFLKGLPVFVSAHFIIPESSSLEYSRTRGGKGEMGLGSGRRRRVNTTRV